MKVDQVLRMVGGSGETSYASNSKPQANMISHATPLMREAVFNICSSLLPKCLVVSDLGCSSGPNTFMPMTEIINAVEDSCCSLKITVPEVQIFLNDLPGNDFNSVFGALSSYKEKVKEGKGDSVMPFYVAGVPDSFYTRLFLSSSIHFMHSSCSLQWLSQVPEKLQNDKYRTLNKGNIAVAKSSSPYVLEAYSDQFQRDFTTFLKLRGEELVPEGRMVLTIPTNDYKDTSDSKYHDALELLAEALQVLVSKGLLEESQVHNFNLPLYVPYVEEVKEVIQREGSYHLDHLQIFGSYWDSFDRSNGSFDVDNTSFAGNVAKTLRAGLEPVLASHFGTGVIDKLFMTFAEILAAHLSEEKIKQRCTLAEDK